MAWDLGDTCNLDFFEDRGSNHKANVTTHLPVFILGDRYILFCMFQNVFTINISFKKTVVGVCVR